MPNSTVMQLSVAIALTTVAVLAAQCSGSPNPELWALLAVDGLARSSTLSPAVSEVLQKYRFRLVNHRVHERTPKELLERVESELRAVGAAAPQLHARLEVLIREAPENWQSQVSSKTSSSSSACARSAPEVALSELNNRCTTGLHFSDVRGCLGAVADYCSRVAVPGKRLSGTISNAANGLITVACREGFGPVSFPGSSVMDLIVKYCHGNLANCCQSGAFNYCRWTHGPEYTGLAYTYDDRMFFLCLKQARMEWVPASVLTELNGDCNGVDLWSRYGCIKAASTFCRRFFGHAGGVVQAFRFINYFHRELHISCFDADYSGEAHISRDVRFFEAKARVKEVCSLDFEVDHGKILSSVPDDLKVETYDNQKSSVELRDSFTISRSVTTESSFSHSHSLSVGAEISVKGGIPFIGESEIKVSSSYTAEFSLSKTNSRTTQYSQTSEVAVPPGHAIRKKATITRSKMDVPWKAEAVNGLGRAVTLTGTWIGVDVSDVRVTQEDL